MKVTKAFRWISLFFLCIFPVSAELVLADQSSKVDAYVTDWTDKKYLLRDVYSDYHPNSRVFFAYHGDSTLTIPFSNIKRIIVTERFLLTRSENKSSRQYHCVGKIILKDDASLECSWGPSGWKGGNNFGGEIFIGKNYWKEIKFGYFHFNKGKESTSESSAYPYTIHVSSYKEKQISDTVAMKLREKNIPAFACPVHIPGKGDFYRIFIGFYGTLEETRTAASKLKGQKDIYPLEAKMPYAIQVGSFDSDQERIQLEADLRSKAYLAYSIPEKTDNNKTRLLIGAFRTEEDASRLTEKLQKAGFTPRVVSR